MTSHVSRRSLLAGAALGPLAFAVPACASGEPEAAASTREPDGHDGLREQLRSLEDSYRGRIGAFAIDTGNGTSVGHRADERFPLCSTFKVLAASAVLRQARRSGSGPMERVVDYDENDLVPHSPVTKQQVDCGMSVSELCRAALTHSDNTAGNLLLEQLGGPDAVTEFARSLSDSHTRLDRREIALNKWEPGEKRDTTTPRVMGRDLRKLAYGEALHADDSARLRGWLHDNTTGADSIQAGLPENWTIGDKTGGGLAYAPNNDIAIAAPLDGAPIVLAVYTNRENKDAEPDDAMIAKTATILARALGRLDG